jgi:hypothetical protein
VESLHYSSWNIATGSLHLGITVRDNLRWTDQVNYVVQKAWKALHILKGNSNTKSLAYTSPVRPILEYGADS